MTAHCGCGSNATSSNTASQPFGRRSPTDSSRTTTSDAKVPFLRWFQGWDRARVASTSEPVDAHLNGTGALLVQLAFVYRDAAETERQNVPPGRLGSTGVHSPGCSGTGTTVCGRRRGCRGNRPVLPGYAGHREPHAVAAWFGTVRVVPANPVVEARRAAEWVAAGGGAVRPFGGGHTNQAVLVAP